MKNLTFVRTSILIAFLVALAIIVVQPVERAQAYDDRPSDVRFTIINYSQHPFSISLTGPEQYTFNVAPYAKKVSIVPRGTYSFQMKACNHTSSGSINLNIFQTMHVPVCGGTAGAVGDKNHNVDTSDYIKPVKITIRNKTGEAVKLYLRTLENHYYLNLEARESTTLIVPRDRYVYSFFACDELVAGYYEARVMIPLELKCSGN